LAKKLGVYLGRYKVLDIILFTINDNLELRSSIWSVGLMMCMPSCLDNINNVVVCCAALHWGAYEQVLRAWPTSSRAVCAKNTYQDQIKNIKSNLSFLWHFCLIVFVQQFCDIFVTGCEKECKMWHFRWDKYGQSLITFWTSLYERKTETFLDFSVISELFENMARTGKNDINKNNFNLPPYYD